ncbi:hypothetical protein [Kitasatospora sp. NPDC057198]|uniref:hypothetical protein n=1 Tax=Kitasatospora sp. NPDC057198 TaxID=3346046 RepID=UPI00363CF8C8
MSEDYCDFDPETGEGCGACEDCREAAIEEIDAAVEYGEMGYHDSRAAYAALGVELLTDEDDSAAGGGA